MSLGAETSAAQWTFADKKANSAECSRKSPQKAAKIQVSLPTRQATFDGLNGQVHTLTLDGEPGDVNSWKCSCPAAAGGLSCLHTYLLVRALTEDETVEPATARVEEEAGDSAFAQDLEASAGLLAAFARYERTVSKMDDQSVRVQSAGGSVAVVRKAATGATSTGLQCDCPMADAAACLHRLAVHAWSAGQHTSTPSAVAKKSSVAAKVGLDRPKVAGEKLPSEDVLRFVPVLNRLDHLIAELVAIGLSRTTHATIERVLSLAISVDALGVREGAPRHAGLGRIKRRLDGFAELLSQFQQKLVTATEMDLVRELAILRNLSRAIRANTGALPLFDFAGAPQQEYVDVPSMDVQGLGLEAWITNAGYAGVTVFIADLRTGRILTRTNALPADQAQVWASKSWGFGWADTLLGSAVFGGGTVDYPRLAKSHYLLSGAKVAPDSGRVSGSSKTQFAERPKLALDDPKLRPSTIVGAADVLRIASRLSYDPIGRPPPSPAVALIAVKSFGASQFDSMTQRLYLSIQTTGGANLPVVAEYREHKSIYLDNLEKLSRAAAPPPYLLARVSLSEDGLSIEPLTAWIPVEKKGAIEYRPVHLTYQALDIELTRSQPFAVTVQA